MDVAESATRTDSFAPAWGDVRTSSPADGVLLRARARWGMAVRAQVVNMTTSADAHAKLGSGGPLDHVSNLDTSPGRNEMITPSEDAWIS